MTELNVGTVPAVHKGERIQMQHARKLPRLRGRKFLGIPLAAGAVVTAAVLAGGGGVAYALTASSSSVPKPGNYVIYGCVSGSTRTLEHVYTVAANFKGCPSGSFAVAFNSTGPRGATGAAGKNGTNGKNGANGTNGTNGASVTASPATSAECPNGGEDYTLSGQTTSVCNGTNGTDGTNGTNGTPILYESTGTSTPDLALDMAPGPDGSAGSAGWGWDSTTNAAVTDLTVGTDATFTATVIQPNTEQADGTITLTYDPYDFSLVTLPGDGTCTTIEYTQQETCSFTDLSHSATSKPFVFDPQHADPDAVIGVSVVVNGEEATGFYPVQISAASSS